MRAILTRACVKNIPKVRRSQEVINLLPFSNEKRPSLEAFKARWIKGTVFPVLFSGVAPEAAIKFSFIEVKA